MTNWDNMTPTNEKCGVCDIVPARACASCGKTLCKTYAENRPTTQTDAFTAEILNRAHALQRRAQVARCAQRVPTDVVRESAWGHGRAHWQRCNQRAPPQRSPTESNERGTSTVMRPRRRRPDGTRGVLSFPPS